MQGVAMSEVAGSVATANRVEAVRIGAVPPRIE